MPLPENPGDLQGTNTETDDLMKKCFLDTIVLVLHIHYCFSLEKQIFKISEWGRPRASTGPECGTSRGPNDGTFWGRPQDFSHTCFLNSTQKHIKLTLTSYSKLYSEL